VESAPVRRNYFGFKIYSTSRSALGARAAT
jgi:hypothetical protein